MTVKRKILGRNITPGSEGVEYADDGITPVAFRVLRRGVNPTDKGDVVYTDESPTLIFEAFERRGMPLMIDYNHESCVPLEQRRVSTSEGWGVAAGRCAPEEREPDLWVTGVSWTSTALDRIHKRELTQISPVLGLNERNEVVELVSVALCFEGATHQGALLATRATTGRYARMPYQDLIDALEAALAAGDLEAARAAWAQLKDALASATLSSATDEENKAAMTALTATVEKLSRDIAGIAAGKALAGGGREDPAASAHLVELRRERARAVFTLNPGVVSPDSERSYIQNADPEGAERLVREVKRNVALSRGNNGDRAKPPPGKKDPEELPELSDAEKRMADKHKLSYEEFARTKARQNQRKTLLGRGGAA